MSAYHEKYLGEPGPDRRAELPDGRAAPAGRRRGAAGGLLGDIVLCPAVTERQAREHGRSATAEAEYLLVHGLLHLLGYDHAEPDDEGRDVRTERTRSSRRWSDTTGPDGTAHGLMTPTRLDAARHRAGPGDLRGASKAAAEAGPVLVLQSPGPTGW